MTGRWDINYIEKPRKSISKACHNFQIKYLTAMKDSNPNAWNELKNIIKKVENPEVIV